MERTVAWAAAGFLVLLGGCKTVSVDVVTTSEAAEFNKTVAEAAKELKASVAETQTVELEASVDDFVQSGSFKLGELTPVTKLSDRTAKELDSQFEFLVAYSVALKKVTSPPNTWSTSVASLSSAASKATGDASSLSATEGRPDLLSADRCQKVQGEVGKVANVVASVGQAAITLYGEDRAYKIAHATNSTVQDYCADLEDVLCKNPAETVPTTGLAGLLYADYQKRLLTLEQVYVNLHDNGTTSNPSLMNQRAVAAEYVLLKKSQADGVAAIRALRKCLEKIADAHAAMSEKDEHTFRQKIQDAQDLIESLKAAAAAPAAAAAAAPAPTPSSL